MAQDFVIRIRADDAATATVNKIKAALSKVTDPIDKAQKRVGKLGDDGQSSISKLTKGLDGTARAATGVVDKIVEIIPGLAAIGSAASVAGLSALTVKFGNFGFALNKNSKLIGMNAQDLASWHVAAKRAGVSADEFDSAMSGSQMAIRAAANGADPHALVMLEKMGVQIARNKDGTVDYYTTQMRLMKAIPKLKTVEAQRDVAGTFSMGSLLPMLQQGTYEADKARAIRKGLVPSADELARAVAFHQNVNDLEDSVSGLGNSIGSRLIPILDPLVSGFAKWLDAHRGQIADQIASAVQKLADWLSKIDWDDVSNKAKTLWDNLGGVKGVALIIAGLKFAGPIGGVANLISSLVTLTTATIPAAAGAFGALGVAGAAAFAAIKVAEATGLAPETDKQKGVEAVKNGEWSTASQYLPLGDFARALAARASGRSNIEIAGWLQADANPASNDQSLGERQKYLFNRLKAAGYTDAQAAGQVGSLMQENGALDPHVTNASGHAGIAQWGADRGKQFEKMFGHSVARGTFGEQTDFYLWEMQNTEKRADQRIRLAKTPEEAAEVQAREFERPGSAEANIAQRQRYAASLFAGLTGGAGNAPADETAASPVGTDGGGNAANEHDARVADMQKVALDITFHGTPAGVRPEAKSASGSYLPTRVNYAMGLGDMGAMP